MHAYNSAAWEIFQLVQDQNLYDAAGPVSVDVRTIVDVLSMYDVDKDSMPDIVDDVKTISRSMIVNVRSKKK